MRASIIHEYWINAVKNWCNIKANSACLVSSLILHGFWHLITMTTVKQLMFLSMKRVYSMCTLFFFFLGWGAETLIEGIHFQTNYLSNLFILHYELFYWYYYDQISNAFLLFVLVISICIQVTLTKIFLSVLNNKTDVF